MKKMIFKGISPVTLLDYPKHVACTLFTGGCNFRCPYCHNADLVLCPATNTVSEDEVLLFLKNRIGLLEGVCITGGEPTLYPELPKFISKVKSLGYKVKLDTNGTNPEMVEDLIYSDLIDMVAMDIKSSPESYDKAAGVAVNIENIKHTARILMEGKIEYEFRTTMVRGLQSDEDMKQIGEWLSGTKAYYLQNFVDSGKLIDSQMTGFTPDEMSHLLEVVKEYIPVAKIRGL